MKNKNEIVCLDKEFKISIKNDIKDIVLDGIQAGINIFTDNKIIQQVPVISEIVRIYNIGNTIHDRMTINKLFRFIFYFLELSPKEKNRIINSITKNDHSFNMYIDYLLIILDKLNDEENTELVGKVFSAFINEEINDLELRQYCFVINMLMPGDLETLLNGEQRISELINVDEAYLRFLSMGLMVEDQDKYLNEYLYSNGEKETQSTLDPNNHYIRYTKFGKKFISIITSYEK